MTCVKMLGPTVATPSPSTMIGLSHILILCYTRASVGLLVRLQICLYAFCYVPRIRQQLVRPRYHPRDNNNNNIQTVSNAP